MTTEQQAFAPGWLWRQMEVAKREYEKLPQWIKDLDKLPRQQRDEPTYPNHYDKDGYCDNPARGY